MFHFVDVACVNPHLCFTPRVLLCLDKNLSVLSDSVPGCDQLERELACVILFNCFAPRFFVAADRIVRPSPNVDGGHKPHQLSKSAKIRLWMRPEGHAENVGA